MEDTGATISQDDGTAVVTGKLLDVVAGDENLFTK